MDTITPQIEFAAELAGLNDFTGKVAYVPGGYGGLGEAIAWGLAQRGAKVMVSGRDGSKAEALAATLRAAGHEAAGIAMDAHSVPAIRDSVDATVEHYGALDILMNGVGIQREEALLEVTEEAYDEVVQVNGVAPTVVRTEMARHWLENPETRKQIVGRIPLGRVADPRDVVGPALFFCSPGADFVTGQVMYVDGGITASQ